MGTVGKLMPTFYVVGKETHVGESFKGLDPNQITAQIISRINLNPEFCDVPRARSPCLPSPCASRI